MIRSKFKTLVSPAAILSSLFVVGALATSPIVLAGGPEDPSANAPAQNSANMNSSNSDNNSQNQSDAADAGNADATAPTSQPIDMKQATVNRDASFYVRGQVGYDLVGDQGTSSASATDETDSTKPYTDSQTYSIDAKNSRGITGRIAAGYEINHYLSVEVGASIPHSISSTFTQMTDKVTPLPTDSGTATIKTSMYSIDAMAKVTIPFDRFYGFAGAGLAYIHEKAAVSGSTNVQDITGSSVFAGGDVTTGHIVPKIAVGLGYQISNNIGVDVEYARTFGAGAPVDIKAIKGGNVLAPNLKYLPGINTITVGVTYKFNKL